MTRAFWLDALDLAQAAFAGVLLVIIWVLLVLLLVRWVILAAVAAWLLWGAL